MTSTRSDLWDEFHARTWKPGDVLPGLQPARGSLLTVKPGVDCEGGICWHNRLLSGRDTYRWKPGDPVARFAPYATPPADQRDTPTSGPATPRPRHRGILPTPATTTPLTNGAS